MKQAGNGGWRTFKSLALAGTMGIALGLVAGDRAVAAGMTYAEELVPRLNIPRMATPPVIDGTIDPEEWRGATRVMGMVLTGGLEYRDRPVAFWLSWDEQHLYLAFQVDILTEPVPHLKRAYRERYATSVVYDDVLEVGLFMHDRNQLEGEESSFLKFILNSVGGGEYMKNYPSIGQVMFNWTPDFEVANRVYTADDGRHWWEMEVAMDLDDLQMQAPHRAGDRVDIGLFAPLKNPAGWHWLDFPSASGHLEHYGFPRAVLTEDEPYIQVEAISGLHDERLTFRSVVFNPSVAPVAVEAALNVSHGKRIAGGTHTGALEDPTEVLREARLLEVPAGGSVRFDVESAFPELPSAAGRREGIGYLDLALRRTDAPEAAPVYTFACNFWGTDKRYAQPARFEPYLATRIAFNPANGRLALAADALDAPLPEGAQAAGAAYRVRSDETVVAEGRLRYYMNHWYDDLIELGDLAPGSYRVELALVDEAGTELVTAAGAFTKVDEAERFADWWNNDIGNTEQLLQPFEALRVVEGGASGLSIACTRRVYHFGSLGLPVQIEANGGPVLTGPARIVLTVDGEEHVVPTDGQVTVTSQADWRVDFTCAPQTVAGVTFSATGWMEQDGLVELALTYGPGNQDHGQDARATVDIEELRIEWPIDDSLGLHMASMGQGGNYSARTIGEVPQGAGQVWNTRDDIGMTGSGRRAGNFLGNVWVGTEQRGLLWAADSDKGWDPHANVPAHALKRVSGAEPETSTVVMVNNLIGAAEGKAAFKLTAPRTVRFGYNASPFRHLAPGWRLNQRSAAGSFSGGKYKVNWDNGQDFFTILSPPFPNRDRWAEYYDFCKGEAHRLTHEGATYNGGEQRVTDAPGVSAWYGNSNRRVFFTCNQIALRGYGWKSIENPNPYSTFMGDWVDSRGSEMLSKTYRDYMIWLMNRQVKEGGAAHFYFDISFGEVLHKEPAAGFGYRLPDGSLQPESSDTNLREWYKRVFAMMQENDLYPGGVSGHATHGFPMKSLAFMDALLDSEYPMTDSIDVYTSDSMIALGCPHTFGVSINHLQNFQNPTWPLMHDGNDMFDRPEFKQWGISRSDVAFIPYWRNDHVVREVAPGVLASLWLRPPRPETNEGGSVMIALLNYGPDPLDEGETRSGALTLDLAALGVPAEAIAAAGASVRIRQLYNHPIDANYLRHLDWARELLESRFPGQNIRYQRAAMPPIEPVLDAATGHVSGFDIHYHDVKFLAIDWELAAIEPGGWAALAVDDAMHTRLLDWGIVGALPIAAAEIADRIASDAETVGVQAWKRTGDTDGRGNSVLLRITNTGDSAANGTLKLDLAGLDVDVRGTWAEFAGVTAVDGKPVDLRESAEQRRGAMAYNARHGELYYRLAAGETRVFSIDRY